MILISTFCFPPVHPEVAIDQPGKSNSKLLYPYVMLTRSILRASTRLFGTSITLAQKAVTFEQPQIKQNEIISGAPKELITSRVVRIFQEAKPATQLGTHNASHWKLDWDVLARANRWENDLMGYQSSGDYMQGTIMKFDTKEAAIRFAEGQGWSYYVKEPKKRHFRKKEYSANFYHSAGPLKHIRTK